MQAVVNTAPLKMGATAIAAAAMVATLMFCVAALAAVVAAFIFYVAALAAAKFESLEL